MFFFEYRPQQQDGNLPLQSGLVSCSDSYGINPALKGLAPIKTAPTYYATNPKDIQAIINRDSSPEIANGSTRLNVLPPNSPVVSIISFIFFGLLTNVE